VVALHHRSVPNYNQRGEILARDGNRVWRREMGEGEKGWVANEGIRISAIIQSLHTKRFESPETQQILSRLQLGLATGRREMLSAAGFGAADGEFEAQGKPSKPAFFTGRRGYDPRRRFACRSTRRARSITPSSSTASAAQLDYTHFSVVFDTERRLARFTAANIDGSSLQRNEKVKSQWRQDGRIDLAIQCDDDLYSTKGPKEAVSFQRGHLVRRVDPSWGPDAKQAVQDTFHFTNAAPHVAAFNNTIWGNLEDYLLEKCDRQRKRITVFSGPIFSRMILRTMG
jgi:endonuclease G